MKKSAVPFVIIFVGLAGLLLWVRFADRGIEPVKKASASELTKVAEDVLPEAPVPDAWSGSKYTTVTRAVLSKDARSLVDAIGSPDFKQRVKEQFVEEIEAAVSDPPKVVAHGSGIGEWVEMQIALTDSRLALHDKGAALGTLTALASATSMALGTATDFDQMQAAEVSRLRFLSWATKGLQDGEWTKAEAAKISEMCLPAAHREALGAAIQRRFLADDIKKIAEASQSTDMKSAVSAALYDEPPADVGKLLSAMLFRHPRVFDPVLTAKAGAESINQLCKALAGPWPGPEKVLDLVAQVQAPWTDFMAFLAKGDTSAVADIQGLTQRINSTENPVGLALLHRERTSWSNLVQSAYAADSQEAQFRLSAMKAAGQDALFSSVLDPLTGKPYTIDAKGAHTSVEDVGDRYPFVKALAGSPLKI